MLAAAIFQFATNASALGVTLGTASRGAAGSDGVSAGTSYGDGSVSRHDSNVEEESDSRSNDDEVQLLRMRTKHQEIIIFPDPNYICCVVQRVGKGGNASERR